MSNQYHFLAPISFRPDFSGDATASALADLLIPGDIMDRVLERYCRQLDERFRVFVSTSPAPQWAPGLRVTEEIRLQYEIYLPVSEIKIAISALCKRASHYSPSFDLTPIFPALSWPDFLERLQPFNSPFNPAALIKQLSTCEELRHPFLATLFIPKRFGGGFCRYPVQSEFLYGWLGDQKDRLAGKISVLDV